MKLPWRIIRVTAQEPEPRTPEVENRLWPDPHFEWVMGRVNEMLDDYSDLEDQIAALDYALEAIKIDFIGKQYTKILYANEPLNSISYPFVQSGKPHIMTVDLAKAAVVSSPWRWYGEKRRFCRSIADIRRNGFREFPYQQKAFFIPELNMLFVTSGQHHISVAALRKTGKIRAEVHLMRDILRRYVGSSVGLWDKGAHKGRGALNENADPRLCLLLEIYRKKYHLQNKLAAQRSAKGKAG